MTPPDMPAQWALAETLVANALEEFVSLYDANNPMRMADMHRVECVCIRCVRDRAEAALFAFRRHKGGE